MTCKSNVIKITKYDFYRNRSKQVEEELKTLVMRTNELRFGEIRGAEELSSVG